jgi:adenylate cyclase
VQGATYYFAPVNQWSPNLQASLERASSLAQKALSLDDSNSDALGLLSAIDLWQGRIDQAVAERERAVTINPNYAAGYGALSNALIQSVKPEEALRAAEKAIRLDPAGQDYYGALIGVSYNVMGRYEEAIPYLERAVAAYPNLLLNYLPLIFAYVESGRDLEARRKVAELMRISPHYTLSPVETSLTKDKAMNQRFASALRSAGLK